MANTKLKNKKHQLTGNITANLSMRPRAKSSMDNQVPGPGNYEPFKSSVVLEHAPKFGHDKRDGDVGSPVPGPGSYNYENAFNRYASRVEPSYGIGSRLPDSKGM